MDFRRESLHQTLDFYALCVGGIMHEPLDFEQRVVLVAHLERVLPPLALKEIRSEWAMGLALAVTQEALANPNFFGEQPRRASSPAKPQVSGSVRTPA